MLSAVPSRSLGPFTAAQGTRHLHLAAIVDVIAKAEPDEVPGGLLSQHPDTAIVAAELVAGRTLRGQLKTGRMPPFKAVAWALRLVEALRVVHQKGGIHGAISPRSIVVEPAGRAIAPVLAQLVAPPIAGFCSPERLEGGGPTPEDDVWALHAVLYSAMTGVAPHDGDARALLASARSGTFRPLSSYGIEEPILQRILERGLFGEASRRVKHLSDVAAALDSWERGQDPGAPPARQGIGRLFIHCPEPFGGPVLEGSSLPDGEVLTTPEPLSEPDASVPGLGMAGPEPPGAGAHPGVRPDHSGRGHAPRSKRIRTAGWVALGAGSLVAAVVTLLVTGRERTNDGAAAPSIPELPAVNSGPASDGVAPAELSPAEMQAACIRSYFETGTPLDQHENFDFVCNEKDFRIAARRLFDLAYPRPEPKPRPAPSEPVAGGVVVRGEGDRHALGWFELPAAAVIRTTCCAGPEPVNLPQTAGLCQQLQAQVRLFAEASKKPVDLGAQERHFLDAVQCLYSTGTERPYVYQVLPTTVQRQAFQRFLSHAAESDAKRSKMKRNRHR